MHPVRPSSRARSRQPRWRGDSNNTLHPPSVTECRGAFRKPQSRCGTGGGNYLAHMYLATTHLAPMDPHPDPTTPPASLPTLEYSPYILTCHRHTYTHNQTGYTIYLASLHTYIHTHMHACMHTYVPRYLHVSTLHSACLLRLHWWLVGCLVLDT